MAARARFLAVPIVVLALAALSGCAITDSPGSGPETAAPAYRVGDRWVYHGEDGFRVKTVWDETHEVTAIGADGITVRVTQKGPTLDVARTEIWSAPGQVKVGAVYDNETRRFAVPLQRWNFPLANGEVWSQRVDNFDESTKTTTNINRWVKIGDRKKVSTPAGTFDAIYMQIIMHLGDDTFWRWGTDCTYEAWYAPEVRGLVREEKDAQYQEKSAGPGSGSGTIRVQHGTLELVSFTPGR